MDVAVTASEWMVIFVNVLIFNLLSASCFKQAGNSNKQLGKL